MSNGKIVCVCFRKEVVLGSIEHTEEGHSISTGFRECIESDLRKSEVVSKTAFPQKCNSKRRTERETRGSEIPVKT